MTDSDDGAILPSAPRGRSRLAAISRRAWLIAGASIATLLVVVVVAVAASGGDDDDPSAAASTTRAAEASSTAARDGASTTAAGGSTTTGTGDPGNPDDPDGPGAAATTDPVTGGSIPPGTTVPGATVPEGPTTTLPPPPTTDPPTPSTTAPDTRTVTQAYEQEYARYCTEAWAASPDGILYDPVDPEFFYELSECLDYLDPSNGEFYDNAPEAAQAGIDDAISTMEDLTLEYVLCWLDPATEQWAGCWYSPYY